MTAGRRVKLREAPHAWQPGAPVNDAADYARSFAAKPWPLTLEQAARITPPSQATDTEGLIDVPRMRAWRRNRLREQIVAYGLDAVVLAEPLSIRYATGVRNCALFQMHIQAGYLFMPADGPVIYFDSQPGRETARQLETIDEVRDDLVPLSHMFSGYRQREKACKWAAQVGDLIVRHCGADARIGVDRPGLHAEQALIGRGFTLVDAAAVLAHARKIKCPEEILAMNLALTAAETACPACARRCATASPSRRCARIDLCTCPVKVEGGIVFVKV